MSWKNCTSNSRRSMTLRVTRTSEEISRISDLTENLPNLSRPANPITRRTGNSKSPPVSNRSNHLSPGYYLAHECEALLSPKEVAYEKPRDGESHCRAPHQPHAAHR